MIQELEAQLDRKSQDIENVQNKISSILQGSKDKELHSVKDRVAKTQSELKSLKKRKNSNELYSKVRMLQEKIRETT